MVLASDTANCGACGKACPADQIVSFCWRRQSIINTKWIPLPSALQVHACALTTNNTVLHLADAWYSQPTRKTVVNALKSALPVSS